MGALLKPFPPLRHGVGVVAAAGPRRLGELARTALVPVRRFVDEHFDGQGAKLLFAGNALHADRTEEHTSELQSLMRISYAVFSLTKKTTKTTANYRQTSIIYQ